jgi:hypothetical protein
MLNNEDPFAWEYRLLDAEVNDLQNQPTSDKRLVITRHGLMRMVNDEVANSIIPAWFSYHYLKSVENICFCFLNLDNQCLTLFYLHFLYSGLLLFVADFFCTGSDITRHDNRWMLIFSLTVFCKLFVEMILVCFSGTHSYIREALNLGLLIFIIQDFVSNISNRLEYFLHGLPQEIEVLVVPYQFLESPWMISWYIKWIDKFFLNKILTWKPPLLKIEYDGHGQLGNENHDECVYMSLVCDIQQLHPNIYLDLKDNHLFNLLTFSQIDAFITSIPFEKRKQIDLSENGESDYQRAFGPVLQMSRQYHLNENVGKEILSFLPR